LNIVNADVAISLQQSRQVLSGDLYTKFRNNNA